MGRGALSDFHVEKNNSIFLRAVSIQVVARVDTSAGDISAVVSAVQAVGLRAVRIQSVAVATCAKTPARGSVSSVRCAVVLLYSVAV